MHRPARHRPWTALVSALVDGIDDAPVRWRVLAALYLTAAPLTALTLLVAHGHDATDWAIGALAAAATLVGLAILALAGRLPGSWLGALLALGTVMITLAILASGD